MAGPSHPTLALVLFGLGILGLCFSLARTYYLVWKLGKDRRKVPRKPKPPDDSL